MSIKQTYDNYYRAYYLKNRKKILAKTKDYRRKYARDYYYKKKAAKIAAEKASKAPTVTTLREGTQVVSTTAILSGDVPTTPTDKSRPFNDPLPGPEDYLAAG